MAIKKLEEIRLNVQPVSIEFVHEYVFEGPCRFGKGDALTKPFDEMINEEKFQDWYTQLKAHMHEDVVNLLPPIRIHGNEDWYIKVEDVQAAEGMNGIPVALLAMNHPIGIIFTGIFIAYMQVSGFYMQTYGFTTEIVDIIVSVIVYFSAFSFIIREGIRRWQLRQRTDVHHTGKGAEK